MRTLTNWTSQGASTLFPGKKIGDVPQTFSTYRSDSGLIRFISFPSIKQREFISRAQSHIYQIRAAGND